MLLAAGVTLPFLGEVVAILAACLLMAYLCYRTGLAPIAGYLLAGVAIGPGGLGLVGDLDLVQSLAEIGVILLLFTIGVEFSLEKLARIGRSIFVGGGLQVGLSVALVALVGLALGLDLRVGIFTGFLVALSSTAIVLSLLAERAETDTPAGRLTLAILIFQDLAIVAMVLAVPLLGAEGGSLGAVLTTLGLAAGIILLVLVLARKAVPWLLEQIARTRRAELFLLAVVAICFGTAYLTSLAGVSLALGAFLAGLVVSESHYSEHALSEILPLRTLFNAVFFVSVGMLLDLGFFLSHLPLVLAAAAAVLILKLVVATGSVLALGYPVRLAGAAGLSLAQIGEFSFVLALAGAEAGLSPGGLGEEGQQTFIAVTVLLMIATPFLMQGGPRLGAWLERTPLGRMGEPEAPSDEVAAMEDHVIVVGYGPAGQRLAQVLQRTGIPFVIVDLNPRSVEAARAEGLKAIYGDAARPVIFEHAGGRRAKLCVAAINDAAATRRLVRLARYENPTLQIVARARYLADVEPLRAAGADVVVPEELETSIRLFRHVLGAYLVAPEEIERQTTLIRAGDYEVLRRGSIHEAHLMVLQGLDEEGLHTRAVAVREGAPAAGQTLAELALRPKHGLTVLAVRRGGTTHANPSATFHVEPGDRLVLIGGADQFAESADLFRPAAETAALSSESGVLSRES